MVTLMVTSDDCGLSEGIDTAAVQLFQRGIVSSASLMTNFPRIHTALGFYEQYPDIELGIHLNLSDGEPLTKGARRTELVKGNGIFRNRLILFALSVFPSAELLDVMRTEMRAQIEVVLEAGIQPAHLTTHCHFHIFPAIRDVVYELAETYHVKWVRNSDVRLSVVPYNPILQSPNTDEQPHSFNVPNYIVSLQHWLDYPPQQLVDQLLQLEGTAEIVVHPSVAVDHTYPTHVAYSPAARYRELIYLQRLFTELQPHLGEKVIISQTSS